MAKMNGKGLEALAVRRTSMADADKVRYLVYRNPKEYIAVIAESALMAVKVSGIAEPHRIVRDLPVEGVAIHADRMVAGDSGQRVNLGLEKTVKEKQVSLPKADGGGNHGDFVPMQLRDLDQKSRRSMRILSAHDLAALMGGAGASAQPAPAVEEPAPTIVEIEVAAEPEPQPVASEELTPEQVANLLNE